VAKHDVARFVHVVVEQQTRFGVAQELSERCLAGFDGLAAQVLTIKLDEVEGVEEHAPVITSPPQSVEHRQAIAVTGDRFTVDQKTTALAARSPPQQSAENGPSNRVRCG